jgi:hypothetical protein
VKLPLASLTEIRRPRTSLGKHFFQHQDHQGSPAAIRTKSTKAMVSKRECRATTARPLGDLGDARPRRALGGYFLTQAVDGSAGLSK